MLKLTTDLDSNLLSVERARKKAALSRLKRELGLYFGFISKQQVAEALALRQTLGIRSQQSGDARVVAGDRSNPQSVRSAIEDLNVVVDPVLSQVFGDIIEDGDEAQRYLDNIPNTESLKKTIQDRLVTSTNNQNQLVDNYRKCIKMHYSRASTHGNGPAFSSANNSLDAIFFNDLDNAVLAETDEAAKRRIVAARMTHPLIAPGEKNGELLSVFFNAIPTLELTRATPVMNVTIFFSRPDIVEDGRLSALTLQKSIEGAVQVDASNPSILTMNLASQITGSLIGQPDQKYTVVGLELFRAPQTLQNIEASKQKENHLAPIIDPMRPIASIKSFTLEMQSAYGLQGTRNGSLEMVLHDRSKLGDFANFVKPDRYGTAFIEVEYGWSHPDPIGSGNPYADLLNLSRVKDHLNIISTNLNFDEVGQVNISLNLIGRGNSEITELPITGPEDVINIQAQIRQIEQLSTTINRLSSVVLGSGANVDAVATTSGNETHRREIRGIQALSAAQDAVNNLTLSPEVIEALSNLQQTLNQRQANGNASTETRQAAIQLQNALRELYGNVTGRGDRRRTTGGLTSSIQNTINRQVNDILLKINTASTNSRYNDIFLNSMPNRAWQLFTTSSNNRPSSRRTTPRRRVTRPTPRTPDEIRNAAQEAVRIAKVKIAASGNLTDAQAATEARNAAQQVGITDSAQINNIVNNVVAAANRARNST